MKGIQNNNVTCTSSVGKQPFEKFCKNSNLQA